MIRYVGDTWAFNFKVTTLPDDWADLEFVVDIGPEENLAGAPSLTVTLAKTDIPEGETAEGWLYGAATREQTAELAPGRYYMQVSRWKDGEPVSKQRTIVVKPSFNRTAPGES